MSDTRSYPETKPARRFVPVIVDGEIQLFDIYINGEWIGSRRTEQQAIQAAEQASR